MHFPAASAPFVYNRAVKASTAFRALSSLCSAVFAVGSSHAASPPIVAGPFEVQLVPTRIGASGFPNITMNPFQKTTISMFRVRHRGKPVTVVDGQNTIREFSDVRILDEAPHPTLLLVAAGAYLLHKEQGLVKIDILAPAGNNPVQWQWLDVNGGQPGPETGPRLRDATGEPLTERGGRLLLVSRRRVLDVHSLRHYPIVVNTTEHIEAMGGYNAGNDAARALSPGRSQFVVVGSRRGSTESEEYALVMAEFATGRVYGLPLDGKALRLQSMADVTPPWIGHYFEWTREPGGVERLKLRLGVTPLPRLGRFVRFSAPTLDYRLAPTALAMYDAFLAFLRAQYGAQDTTPSGGSGDGPRSKTLAIDGHVLQVWYRADDRTTSLYAELGPGPVTTDVYTLIEKIGTRFNEALAHGEHQDLFEDSPPAR